MRATRFRYEEFAEKHMQVTVRTGAEFMVRCLFHDERSGSMQFNVENGLFICFACHEKGNIKTLQNHLGLRSIEEAEVDVADILAKLDALKAQDLGEVPDPQLPVLPESYLKRYDFPSRYWTDDRGFTEQTVMAFDLGYDPMHNYATIPIRNIDGGLIGVVKRYLDDGIESADRYRYPKGYKRSKTLFGAWLVEQDPDAYEVAITEGSLDAVKVWQAGFPAVAQYGSSISRDQIKLLLRLGVRSVVLFYDNDKGGRQATDYALGWHTHRVRDKKTKKVRIEKRYDPTTDLTRLFHVRVVDYGKLRKKDPGAMSRREIKASIAGAKPIL